MPLSLSDFVNGAKIEASELMDRIASVEAYVNGGIADADIKAAPWVKSGHLFRSEFYTEYAPRCHAVTRDTHWRSAGHGENSRVYLHPDQTDGPVSIPDLAASIKVPVESSVDVMLSFYAWQFGGDGGSIESAHCAEFELYLNGAIVPQTKRALAVAGIGNWYFSRKQFSISCQLTIPKGINHIALMGTAIGRGTTTDWLHVFIDARSLVIQVPVR